MSYASSSSSRYLSSLPPLPTSAGRSCRTTLQHLEFRPHSTTRELVVSPTSTYDSSNYRSLPRFYHRKASVTAPDIAHHGSYATGAMATTGYDSLALRGYTGAKSFSASSSPLKGTSELDCRLHNLPSKFASSSFSSRAKFDFTKEKNEDLPRSDRLHRDLSFQSGKRFSSSENLLLFTKSYVPKPRSVVTTEISRFREMTLKDAQENDVPDARSPPSSFAVSRERSGPSPMHLARTRALFERATTGLTPGFARGLHAEDFALCACEPRSQSTHVKPLASPAALVQIESESTENKAGMIGLYNVGNTCYMNAILQCLSHTKDIRKLCLDPTTARPSVRLSTTKQVKNIWKPFAKLISQLWNYPAGSESAINPREFKACIEKAQPRFAGARQNDSHEFLRFLLSELHDELNKAIRQSYSLPALVDGVSDSVKSAQSWKRYALYDNSEIVDIFVGQLKSKLTCLHCGNVSTTFDPFWDLSLPLPAVSAVVGRCVQLSACFDAFSKEEMLKDEEMPVCSMCHARRPCTKKLSIQKFPDILVLHLKRFHNEQYQAKLSTFVEFPVLGLNLSPYAVPDCADSCLYNLYAICNHFGSTNFGHYTSFCKHSMSHEWVGFDDERVKVFPNETGLVTPEAYVLFYEKSSRLI